MCGVRYYTVHILYGSGFIRLFEKMFDRLEMVRNRARVPSPRHDKKKAYEQLRGRLFSGENEPGAKPEPTAYEQLRDNRSLGRVCFWLSFLDPFLPVENFFKMSA